MANEVQHHHRMEHTLNPATFEDLDNAISSHVLDYEHSHESGDIPHSHEHNSSVAPDPKNKPKPKAKVSIWSGNPLT